MEKIAGKEGAAQGKQKNDRHPADPAFGIVEKTGKEESNQELQVDRDDEEDQRVPNALQIDRVMEKFSIAFRTGPQLQPVEDRVDHHKDENHNVRELPK